MQYFHLASVKELIDEIEYFEIPEPLMHMEKLFGSETYPYESNLGIAWRIRDRSCISASVIKAMYKKRRRLLAEGIECDFPPIGCSEWILGSFWPIHFFFRFCRFCLAEGYHSVWHQAETLVLCPIHDCDLSIHCECCRRPVGMYDKCGNATRTAFICNYCNGPISGYIVKVRAEPSNTEVYALAEARLSKLEAWTKVVEDIRISSGDIKNFPYFSRLSTHRRFPVFLRFNTPLPLAPEHFVPFPDLIYLKFKNRPTSMFFRLGRTNFPNGRSFSHLLSLRLFLTRVADAFKIKSLPNPDAVMAQKCPPAAAALSTIQYMFDFTRPVHDSPLGAHFELVGREVVQCTAHKFEFVFRILAIYSELLDFFSYRVGNEGIPVAEMQRAVDQLTSYARFSKTFYRPSADVKDCATATLALPASPEFTRLTSRGIFRRWKNNFATTAVR